VKPELRACFTELVYPIDALQIKSNGLTRQGRYAIGVLNRLELELAAQSVRKPDSPVEETLNAGRLALILAAEKMIAVHGVGAVSLRQINEAAGHKNSGATHYHFGSRQGLIQAVLAYRVGVISVRRAAIVEKLQGQPTGPDIRDLVTALANPLVDELRPRSEGNYFLRFSERVRREVEHADNLRNLPVDAWRFARAALVTHLAHLPPVLADLRVQLALDQIISGLASIETKLQKTRWTNDTFIEIEALIDFIAAGLAGPAAPPLLAALQQTESGDTKTKSAKRIPNRPKSA
jgi:AcrR family transcriptional regulator